MNRVYSSLLDREERYGVVFGGRRSGKSHGVGDIIAIQAATRPGRKIVCMRKVARTIRVSLWPRMLAALASVGALETAYINKSDKEILLSNGTMILFLGADDSEKLKSIEGVTDYWLEEATEFSEGDFDTIDVGLSADVEPPPRIWLTFNPIPMIPGQQHWIQRRFLSVQAKMGELTVTDEAFVLRTWHLHNAFLPQRTRDVLEAYKETNPQLYRMWVLGEFTTVEGAILSDWDIVAEVPDGVPFLGYGLDFGYANDPAALVAIWSHNDDLYLREELYQTGLTNQDIARIMREDLEIDRGHVIIADSAEPKSIAEIRAEGFTITGSDKGPDYKRSAARWLQSKHIHVVEGSPNAQREVSTWSWDRDRSGNILPRPADGNDHAIDATIYGAYKRQRRWRMQ